jgi:hypothetical protein
MARQMQHAPDQRQHGQPVLLDGKIPHAGIFRAEHRKDDDGRVEPEGGKAVFRVKPAPLAGGALQAGCDDHLVEARPEQDSHIGLGAGCCDEIERKPPAKMVPERRREGADLV